MADVAGVIKKVPPWAWLAGGGIGLAVFLLRPQSSSPAEPREETIVVESGPSYREADLADAQSELEAAFNARFIGLESRLSDQLRQIRVAPTPTPAPMPTLSPTPRPPAPVPQPTPRPAPIPMPVVTVPVAPPPQPIAPPPPREEPARPANPIPGGVFGCNPSAYKGRLRKNGPWNNKPSGELERRVTMVHIICGGPTDGRTPEPYPIWHTSIQSAANRAGINQTRFANALRPLTDAEFDQLEAHLRQMVPDPVRAGFKFSDGYMTSTWERFYRPYICE